MSKKIIGAIFAVLALGPAPVAKAENPICEFALEAAKKPYAASEEFQAYQRLKRLEAQRWHEANLIRGQLAILKKRLQDWPAFKASEPELRAAFGRVEAARKAEDERVRQGGYRKAVREMSPDERTLMVFLEATKEAWKKAPDESIRECWGKYRGFDKVDDKYVTLVQGPTVVSVKGSPVRAETGIDDLKVLSCPNALEVRRYAEATIKEEFSGANLHTLGGPVTYETPRYLAQVIRVSAKNDEFHTGLSVGFEQNAFEFLLEPLPSVDEMARVLAHQTFSFSEESGGLGGLKVKPLSEREFALRMKADVCGAEGISNAPLQQATDQDEKYKKGFADGYSKGLEDAKGKGAEDGR